MAKGGKSLYPLPRWVEPDGLRLKKCTARGILAVEKRFVAAHIAKTESWRPFDLLVVGNYGMPTLQARRFMRLVSEEFDLPVFVLADNDTWGYFMFSLLKRGAVLPRQEFRYLAYSDVRYLGFRAGDADRLGLTRCLIRWERLWDERLEAMSKYPCFRKASWRAEFDAFRRQKGKFELETAPLWRDGRQTQDYLSFALRRKDQLS